MSESRPILIIEDVPNLLDLIKLTLQYKGFSVVTASDGVEGLDKVFEIDPVLVITDIMMPKMDGYTFLQKLRTSSPRFSGTPVILLTATYVSAKDKDFAMHLGATRFITKPVDFEDLIDNIREILAQPRTVETQPMAPLAFYKRYKDRLESKLAEKNEQIARFQLLLSRLDETQSASYKNLLSSAQTDKTNIVNELADAKIILQNLNEQEEQ